ncbi:MAG: hypothetical protein FWD31_14515 [Planctomycetaceae bacterium]|nr:hypothetical protein [Planctomycetaceae bacterium]
MTYFTKVVQHVFLLVLVISTGCEVMPQRRFKPTLHNPRMQLREVAVVPFLNRSGNTHADGEEVAQLYANQLQRIPGFNVMPIDTVKQAMIDTKRARFESVDDIRAFGEYLNVDTVVLGAVNQYSSFQPPSLTLEVEWYATNPYFHPIVAGHGLPWGTPAEKEIPDSVILQVEQDLARAQLATLTPDPKAVPLRATVPDNRQSIQYDMPSGQVLPNISANEYGRQQMIPNSSFPEASDYPPTLSPQAVSPSIGTSGQVMTAYYPQFDSSHNNYLNNYADEETLDSDTENYLKHQQAALDELSQRAQGVFSRSPKIPRPDASRQYPAYQTPVTLPSRRIEGSADTSGRSNLPQDAMQTYASQPLPVGTGAIHPTPNYLAVMPGMPVGQGLIAGEPVAFPGLPANWPDPRGLIPDGPQATPKYEFTVNNEPIMRHVSTYNGNDINFTRRLADYEKLFIDDRRIGGWQGIMRRRTDFISACCCMNIWEMLSSRGGAGKAERVTIQDKFWMNP